MKQYRCTQCDYVYDPDDAISGEPDEVFYDHENGTEEDAEIPFESLDSTWRCPLCGAAKRKFHCEEVVER